MGRFMSPDWSFGVESVPYAQLNNPQSLNLYSFVFNNPLSQIDVNGHAILDHETESCEANAAGSGCAKDAADQYLSFDAGAQAEQISFQQAQRTNTYTLEQVEVAAALADFQAMADSGRHQEWSSNTYQRADGTYGTSKPVLAGPECGEGEGCEGTTSLEVPNGTTLVGVQHTHPWIGGPQQFDFDVTQMKAEGLTFFDYVAGASSNGPNWKIHPNIFRLDPNEPSACQVSGTAAIPKC